MAVNTANVVMSLNSTFKNGKNGVTYTYHNL